MTLPNGVDIDRLKARLLAGANPGTSFGGVSDYAQGRRDAFRDVYEEIVAEDEYVQTQRSTMEQGSPDDRS